jgi:glycine/D-amino acid oxidase-like deaminating enzyme
MKRFVAPMTPEGIPVLGRLPETENLVVASSHRTLGITLGPLTGAIVARLVRASVDPSMNQSTSGDSRTGGTVSTEPLREGR